MVSFRRDKKDRMQDKSGGEGRRQSPEMDEIRVTDRRRINVDGPESEAGEAESPASREAAKRIEELDARARAAEGKLQEVQTRFDQLRAQLQRETDETRQRLNRAAEERAQRAKAEFLSSLLPVLDNLQRALDAARSGSTVEALLNGLQGTISGFENALAAAGAEPLQATGAPFDPQLHEAVDTVEADSPEGDGIVTQEYSKGYKLGERLLRPARVQVGRAAAKGAAE